MMTPLKITKEKEKALLKRMRKLGIREEDLRETFVRSSGPGGQNVNKVSSCVQLLHDLSQTSVKCQSRRSQVINRYLARQMLCERLERKRAQKCAQEKEKREKLRRQKRKRSPQARELMLETKKKRSQKKKLRKKININKMDEY